MTCINEKPKRLAPTKATVRNLFGVSGNECAFKGCTQRIIDSDGVIVGQICHIEAAERGGPRFNPCMTNEQRRELSNLVLLCYKHHKKTDNTKDWSVDRMKKMKADHEAQYINNIEKVRNFFFDYTKEKEVSRARTGEALKSVPEWEDSSPEERIETANDINDFFDGWADIPEETLNFISIVVNRGKPQRGHIGSYAIDAHYDDVVAACSISDDEAKRQIGIIEHHNVGRLAQEYEDYGPFLISIYGPEGGWDMWGYLKDFAEIEKIDLRQIIVNGQLDILDGC